MWRLWSILEQNIEETHTIQRTSQSHHSKSTIDWQTHFVVVDAWERAKFFKSNLSSKFHAITRLPLADFDIILMCSAIVLDNTLSYFLLFIANIFRVFNILERRSKTHSELCIGTPLFSTYYIYAILFGLFSCFAWSCLSSSLC